MSVHRIFLKCNKHSFISCHQRDSILSVCCRIRSLFNRSFGRSFDCSGSIHSIPWATRHTRTHTSSSRERETTACDVRACSLMMPKYLVVSSYDDWLIGRFALLSFFFVNPTARIFKMNDLPSNIISQHLFFLSQRYCTLDMYASIEQQHAAEFTQEWVVNQSHQSIASINQSIARRNASVVNIIIII